MAQGEQELDPYGFIHKREGEAHIIGFELCGVALTFTRLVVSKDDVRGRLEVRSSWPGPERLYAGSYKLDGMNSRRDMARHLKERCPDVPDWVEILERSSNFVIDELAEGSPTVLLTNVKDKVGSRFRIEPIAFDNFPVIWFGKGGSGKSLLAVSAAISVHTGMDIVGLPLERGPVLVCDWELDAETWKSQAALIATGHNVGMPDIHYRRCVAPLYHEGESIARYVAREGIKLVIVDSLGYACGGDKNSQEVATRMFEAMRSWQCAVICIDHVSKDSEATSPYGSVYFENSARATWRVRGAMDEGSNELAMAMTLEKCNFGRYQPQGFKFTFWPDASEPESVHCQRMDVRDLPGFETSVPDSMRIKTAILEAKANVTVQEIVEATGIKEATVRTRLHELTRRGDVEKIVIKGAAHKYALRVGEAAV